MNPCIPIQIFLCILTFLSSFAQWSSNSSVNTPVCTSPNDQQDQRIVSDGKGGAIITWVDYRNNTVDGDIYVQRISANGFAKWTVNGIAICISAGDQSAPAMVEDGDGGAIIVWQDSRSGDKDIYGQRIDSAGNLLWAINGAAVATKISHQQDPKIISDGALGGIVAWQDSANGSWDVFAQRVNGNGIVLWAGNGVPICTAANSQINSRIEINGSGGAIIVWQDKRNGTDYDIYTQNINSGGVVQWTNGGLAICIASDTQSNPKIESDGIGGAVIAWADKRNAGDYNIFAQRINSTGISQWASNGIAICSAQGNQSAVDLTSDGISGAIITWKDFRSGVYADIYAQAVDFSGAVLWTTNGVAITTLVYDQINPNITGDGKGGAIIAWQDSSSGNWNVLAQKLNASGTAQWTTNGVSVGNAADSQNSPKNVSDGAGGSVFVFQDKRSGSYDIYVHHLDSAGSSATGIKEKEDAGLQLSVYPNPVSNMLTFDFSTTLSKGFYLRIVDVFGNSVIKLPLTHQQMHLTINHLPNGFYHFEIVHLNQIVNTGKLSIIK